MKENGPAISVVVPCYKAVRWLPECMDSLFEQTFEDFEIIFVDDGSPDATGKLVDDYAAKYPQVKIYIKRTKALLVPDERVSHTPRVNGFALWMPTIAFLPMRLPCCIKQRGRPMTL